MSTLLFQGQCGNHLEIDFDLLSQFSDEVSFTESLIKCSLKKEDFNLETQKDLIEHNQSITFLMNHLHFLRWQKTHSHKKLDFILGHSLGEINALVASEALEFSDALRLIKDRNKEMNKVKTGKTMAVLGLTAVQIQELLVEAHLDDRITVSIHNDTAYHCLSYPIDKEVDSVVALKKKKAHILMIPHLGPYHSDLMDEAKWEFGYSLDEISFKTPKTTVLSNLKAIPYTKSDARINLYQHLTNPVLWEESVSFLTQCGETEFEELGNKKILSSRIKIS